MRSPASTLTTCRVPRKVLLFTGHRAERSHIDAIHSLMRNDPRIESSVYAFTSMDKSDTLSGQAVLFGQSLTALVVAFEQMAPDFVLAYGDRGEALAATLAASRLGIPVAHVEGGDETYGGVLDDNARFAITRLACLHFATTQHAADHLIAIGEEPWRVKVCGLPILDFVAAGDFTSEDEVRLRYGLGDDWPFTLICHHPVPGEDPRLILRELPSNVAFVIHANGDTGSSAVDRALAGFPGASNVPRADFHGLMNACSLMVGNSSSFVKEAPAFGKPVTLVGNRQKGRYPGPYKALGAGRIIAETLATVPLEGLTIKRRAA